MNVRIGIIKSVEKNEQKIVIYWSWKKTVGLIAAALLVPTLFVWIFALTMKTTVVNPNYYKGVLKHTDTYNRIIQEGIPSLIIGSSLQSVNSTDWLSRELIALAIEKSVDPAWLQTLTNKTIDEIVVFLRAANRANQKVELNLAEADQFLAQASNSLGLVAQMIPTSQPAASASAKPNIVSSANTDQIKQGITNIQQKIASYNLGVVDLSKEITQATSVITFIHKFVRNVNGYFWGSTIIALILIGVIVLVSFKDWYYMVCFLTYPLAIASVLSLIVVLFLSPLAGSDYSNLALNLPKEMNSIIADVLQHFTAGLFHRLEIIAVVIIIVAVAGYITIKVLGKKYPALKKK